MAGKLYLFPTTLGDSDLNKVIPIDVQKALNRVTHFIVENTRTARRFLVKANIESKIDNLHFYEINKFTKPDEYEKMMQPLFEDMDMGILSEAGLPCVADPGSEIVRIAHVKNIKVVPFVGPSSILLALMASGMNGQNFAFLGYLPIKANERQRFIKQIEKKSLQERQTQLFIETPYRNNQLLHDLLITCNEGSQLCIAVDITLQTEFISTRSIGEWRKNVPDINKRPALFLLQA